MIEKDNIEQLFSKAFESHTASVNPELWSGIQSKMAAAGVASSGAAVKGISLLSKWIIGTASVVTIGTVSTFMLFKAKPVEQNQPDIKKVHTVAKTDNQEIQVSTDLKMEQSSVKTQPVLQMPNQPVSSDNTENYESNKSNQPLEIQQEKSSDVSNSVILKPQELITESKTVKQESVKEPEKVLPKKVESPSTNEKPKTTVNLVAKVTHFPNIFTPNNDGYNDTYQVEAENIQNFKLVIINQNNQVMFETTNQQEAWDGTFLGDKAEVGSYAAIVTGNDNNGKPFKDIQLFELSR